MTKKKSLALKKVTVQNLESQTVNGGAKPNTVWDNSCNWQCTVPLSMYCPTAPYCPLTNMQEPCYM